MNVNGDVVRTVFFIVTIYFKFIPPSLSRFDRLISIQQLPQIHLNPQLTNGIFSLAHGFKPQEFLVVEGRMVGVIGDGNPFGDFGFEGAVNAVEQVADNA